MVSQSDLLPMITPTSMLLPLCESVAGFAVEVAQRLRQCDFEAESDHAIEQRDDLFCRRRRAHEAAAKRVGAECLWNSVGPYFDAAVRNHFERETVARSL